MTAPPLDNEFMGYWSKLSVEEKESLLRVAKNYVDSKANPVDSTDFRKKQILKEREAYLQGKGTSYSWNQVKAMAIESQQRNTF